MLRLSSVLGNSQRLDGGAMFGNAPRALWSKWAPPDEQGRVALACRAFLVERSAPAAAAAEDVESSIERVLIETGIGTFFEPALRERYGVLEERHVLLDSLGALGLSDADIDWVLLSHLHFDHAGGALAAHAPGEPARLLFPRARFVVGRTAFERARAPHSRDRASFIPELPALLEASGRLEIVESAAEAERLLGAQFRFRESFGHTPGMLLPTLRGARGSAFFCADLIPGRPWVHLPITMGYDRWPERLVDEKEALYAELLADGTRLLFTHDPEAACAALERDERGRYRPVAAVACLARWDLDTSAAPP